MDERRQESRETGMTYKNWSGMDSNQAPLSLKAAQSSYYSSCSWSYFNTFSNIFKFSNKIFQALQGFLL